MAAIFQIFSDSIQCDQLVTVTLDETRTVEGIIDEINNDEVHVILNELVPSDVDEKQQFNPLWLLGHGVIVQQNQVEKSQRNQVGPEHSLHLSDKYKQFHFFWMKMEEGHWELVRRADEHDSEWIIQRMDGQYQTVDHLTKQSASPLDVEAIAEPELRYLLTRLLDHFCRLQYSVAMDRLSGWFYVHDDGWIEACRITRLVAGAQPGQVKCQISLEENQEIVEDVDPRHLLMCPFDKNGLMEQEFRNPIQFAPAADLRANAARPRKTTEIKRRLSLLNCSLGGEGDTLCSLDNMMDEAASCVANLKTEHRAGLEQVIDERSKLQRENERLINKNEKLFYECERIAKQHGMEYFETISDVDEVSQVLNWLSTLVVDAVVTAEEKLAAKTTNVQQENERLLQRQEEISSRLEEENRHLQIRLDELEKKTLMLREEERRARESEQALLQISTEQLSRICDDVSDDLSTKDVIAQLGAFAARWKDRIESVEAWADGEAVDNDDTVTWLNWVVESRLESLQRRPNEPRAPIPEKDWQEAHERGLNEMSAEVLDANKQMNDQIVRDGELEEKRCDIRQTMSAKPEPLREAQLNDRIRQLEEEIAQLRRSTESEKGEMDDLLLTQQTTASPLGWSADELRQNAFAQLFKQQFVADGNNQTWSDYLERFVEVGLDDLFFWATLVDFEKRAEQNEYPMLKGLQSSQDLLSKMVNMTRASDRAKFLNVFRAKTFDGFLRSIGLIEHAPVFKTEFEGLTIDDLVDDWDEIMSSESLQDYGIEKSGHRARIMWHVYLKQKRV